MAPCLFASIAYLIRTGRAPGGAVTCLLSMRIVRGVKEQWLGVCAWRCKDCSVQNMSPPAKPNPFAGLTPGSPYPSTLPLDTFSSRESLKIDTH